ncbi:LuxR C-terminal-related transcriptional regulator [Corynebacterium wankanglinii]|uniref:Response regulator transcription factor n=1 Tax=Corynebacterium wankanglinii TaxID=2735136 RepID=A0A838CHB7_9CORY|nr:response regulator transcription factor [Corynebacterium wankanglinii]MBA1834458.1 response regulator transcription factor [Corynebacterium wankanglinii]
MTSVFLVDDHSVFRAGVKAELAAAGGGQLEVVGEAGTVAEAVRGIERTRPDVVLLDVHMPDGGGLAVLKRAPGPAYLALSVSDAAEDVIALIRAGARGYVTKNIAGAELAEAIERVRGGDAYFSPRLAGFVLDAFASGPVVEEDVPAVDSLTRRELEVLRLLARGYTYKEIAERLFISVKTVETHASNILRKTQTSNRHQLTRWAVARDLG